MKVVIVESGEYEQRHVSFVAVSAGAALLHLQSTHPLLRGNYLGPLGAVCLCGHAAIDHDPRTEFTSCGKCGCVSFNDDTTKPEPPTFE